MQILKIKITQCFALAIMLASSLSFAETETTKVDNPIIDHIAVDLNDDKKIDTAMLIKSGDQADFYIYLANDKGNLELALTKKDLVWEGALAGTHPQLALAKNGSLYIYSQNDTVGRNRWHQRLTVDYRDKTFMVTGYTYDSNDTLDPKAGLTCDVDLITGNGTKNKVPFKLETQKVKLSDWTNDKTPKQCRD
jgi:hypothetical protein